MRRIRSLCLLGMLTVASFAALGTLGCEREGPLERAGEELDEDGFAATASW